MGVKPRSFRDALLVGVLRAVVITALIILSSAYLGAPDLNPTRTFEMEIIHD